MARLHLVMGQADLARVELVQSVSSAFGHQGFQDVMAHSPTSVSCISFQLYNVVERLYNQLVMRFELGDESRWLESSLWEF